MTVGAQEWPAGENAIEGIMTNPTSPDLTALSWLFLVAFCICVVFSMYLSGYLSKCCNAYADQTLIVGVNGGGYHLWEVTQDELERFKIVRATKLQPFLAKTLTAVATRPSTLGPSYTFSWCSSSSSAFSR
jgi:hypothetical protein